MGRRWGKTFMAGDIVLSCAAAGAAVAWVPPTYKNARPLWHFAEVHTAPVAKRLRISRQEHTMEFPGGGWFGIFTADNPVGILGFDFDLVVVEEAPRIQEAVFYEALWPTLADRDGRAMLIGTPKGRTWFWRGFQKGLDDMQVVDAAFTAPSCANPLPQIQQAYQLAKTRISRDTFRQEWDAEFLEDGAGIFRQVDKAATATHQEAQVIELKGEKGEISVPHQYTIGVDWGRSGDATWFCVIDLTLKQNVHNERILETNYELQKAHLWALYNRFGKDYCTVMAEYNSIGGPLVERLQAEGMQLSAFTTTNQSKMVLIDGLVLALESGELKIENDPELIRELQAYESSRLPTGLIRYGAPEGMHDDGVIALALAWQSAKTGDLVLGAI